MLDKNAGYTRHHKLAMHRATASNRYNLVEKR